MSDRRSTKTPEPGAKPPQRLSPELKEFLHMLQVIEEDPGTCAPAAPRPAK